MGGGGVEEEKEQEEEEEEKEEQEIEETDKEETQKRLDLLLENLYHKIFLIDKNQFGLMIELNSFPLISTHLTQSSLVVCFCSKKISRP